MATYAIGDVQGCWRTLQSLLTALSFVRGRDLLWFAGDLVNRGGASLDVLRFVADLGADAQCVLGNHDVHLLGRAAGARRAKRRDTLDSVLEAPDRDELLEWLRTRPLLVRDESTQTVLVHAGLLPQWDVAEAQALAATVQRALQGPRWQRLLADGRGSRDVGWSAALSEDERVEVVLAACTRLRVCTGSGRPLFGFKGPLDEVPRGAYPWYAVPGRRSRGTTVLFGHWAAHGHAMGPDWIALDSGCVWGGTLTAIRLDDRAVFAVDCVAADRVG